MLHEENLAGLQLDKTIAPDIPCIGYMKYPALTMALFFRHRFEDNEPII
jgi:hypothetical protein